MSDVVLVPWQRRRLPRLPSSTRHAAAAGLLVTALMLLAGGASSLLQLRARQAPIAPAAPPPEWIDVPRPVHIFDLEAPLLRSAPLVYSARRRSAGDGREDMLVYGAPGGDSPMLRLRFDRRTNAASALPPLFAAVARQAAESGLSVTREGLADLLPTRFGRFEVADVTLAGTSAAPLPCSGFRLAVDKPALTIGGLACGAPGKALDRATLACLLDRLDLASGGDDRAMIDFFAASERRRDASCAGARLAPDHLHAAWLDDKPVTRPKTSRRH